MGINAADVLTDLLRHLRDAVSALNHGRVDPWTRFPSPYQFVVQALHSESAHLTLPERADAQVCVTFPPPFSVASMIGFLVEESRRFARGRSLPDLPLIERSGLAVEPVRSPTPQLGVVLKQCAGDLSMPAIDIGPSTGTSDLRQFAAAGIPCVLYGPGTGFNPHRANECYRLADLPAMIYLFLAVAADWCGVEGVEAV
jgi:acetylornithine deacetylase/succinyl-diaminopimelate desuccinylase-like protein